MKSISGGISFLLILISIFFGSCKKENSQEDQLLIKLGVMIPLTGAASSAGESSLAALMCAKQDLEQYLEEIGSGFKIDLLIEDTQSDSNVARQKIQLLKEKGIRLIIGPYTSLEVISVKPYADAHQVLVISPASIATSLEIEGDNVFRLVPTDLTQAEAVDAWLTSDTVEVLVPIVRNDSWGLELLAGTTAKFTAHSGIVSNAVFYDANEEDFSQEIQQLSQVVQDMKSLYPGKKIGIYLVSFKEGTRILQSTSINNFWPECQWYGSTAYAQDKSLLEDFTAGFFALDKKLACPVFGLDEAAADLWQPLMDRLLQSLGRQPEVYAFVSYDALWLAVLTLLNTDNIEDFDILKHAFALTAETYFGVTGRTSLNAAGDRKYAIYDFWSVRYLLNAFMWYKSGWYDNQTGYLVRY